VILARQPGPVRGYDVDAAFMSYQQHSRINSMEAASTPDPKMGPLLGVRQRTRAGGVVAGSAVR
jgi:hypothetical protein